MSTPTAAAAAAAIAPLQAFFPTLAKQLAAELSTPSSMTPTSPYTSIDDNDNSLPTSGKAAIACIILVTVIVILRLSIQFCCGKCLPRYASAPMALNNDGQSMSPYSSRAMSRIPLLVGVVSLVLKLTAMGVDQWDSDSMTIYDTTINYELGVLNVKASALGQSATKSYASVCSALIENEVPQAKIVMCYAALTGSILTLSAGIVTCMVTLYYTITALRILLDSNRFSYSTMTMFKLAEMAHVFAFASNSYWSLGSHLLIHELFDLGMLSTSWFIMLAGTVVDLFAIVFYRKAIQSMPPPYQMATGPYLPMPAQVVSFYPQQQQQQQPLMQPYYPAQPQPPVQQQQYYQPQQPYAPPQYHPQAIASAPSP